MNDCSCPNLDRRAALRALGLALAGALLAAGRRVLAADAIETRPVHFAKGATSATLKGSLKGDQVIDYALRARAGQTMTVSLRTSNGANYFNVLAPGSKDAAIFIGSTSGNDWSATLDADGEYRVRVYLMRSAARRNEKADFALAVGIAGAAGPGTPPATDARVPGTAYHATGRLPCSMGNAPAGSAQCDFGVIRGKPGHAELRLTPPGGLQRVLTFREGKVAGTGNAKVEVQRSADLWLVDVNDYEHYRIPEAVINGG